MIADGFNLTTVELDEGEKIPENIDQFDCIFCMGGPMDTWMTDEFPWLIEEKIKIKHFVIDLEKPFLGFCLGCQLLGEVVGGKVIKSNPPESLNIDSRICIEYTIKRVLINPTLEFSSLQALIPEYINDRLGTS